MAERTTSSEELFDAEFLDRLRALFLRLRKRKRLRKKGMQSSPVTGYTREFKDYRRYTRDDDYRAIDWRLYARLDKLFIRLYEEIQEYHIHVLIDTSGSMEQPFEEKKAAALKLGVALSYLGLVGQHRVSLYTMGERVKAALPPLKGQGNIQRIIDHLSKVSFGGLTNLDRCFNEFTPSRKRYGIIFVVSDFFGTGLNEAREAVRHATTWPGELHFIQLYHPRERSPQLDGEIELVDVETEEHRRLWLTKRDLKRYEETFDKFIHDVEHSCLSRQMDYQQWQTDQAFEDQFLELLSRGSALAGS